MTAGSGCFSCGGVCVPETGGDDGDLRETIGNRTDVGVLGVMTGAGFSSGWTNRPRIPDFSKTIFAGVVEAAAADAELSRHQIGR